MEQFFIGVDGGATKCIVRAEDEAGHLLGRASTGPASIRFSAAHAWDSIQSAVEAIFLPLGININDKRYRVHAGMGLAGCELPEAYHTFVKQPHSYDTLLITSDAHIACVGAHGGKDGAIIIVGTGAVGFQIIHGHTTKVGGWGFPHDDEGGGAWLGLEAIRRTFHWLDRRGPSSRVVAAIYTHFAEDLSRMVTWANQANSTAFAGLAPIVVAQAQEGDAMALDLLQQAALSIDKMDHALTSVQPPHPLSYPWPCTVIGGMAPFITPYLSKTLQDRLSPCQLTPDAGAILLVRAQVESKKHG